MQTSPCKRIHLTGALCVCLGSFNLAWRAHAQYPPAKPLYTNGILDDSVCGVHGYGPVNVEYLKKPFIKGWYITYKWSDLETAKGVYDWKYFDGQMSAVAVEGKYISFMVQAGQACPKWLFDQGVPKVDMEMQKKKHERFVFPYYFHPLYQERYFAMFDAVAAHVSAMPPAIEDRIVFWMSAEGSTGDVGPYKGIPKDPKYRISDEQWTDFKQRVWKNLYSLCDSPKLKIDILINQGNGGQYFDWLMKNIPGVFFKTGNVSHVYQFPGELEYFKRLEPIVGKPCANGNFHRIRGEMDALNVMAGGPTWPKEAPLWNVHSILAQCLYFGLDFFNGKTSDIDLGRPDIFEFFNRHAGQKDPATARGAFCVLRDGLDAMDTKRFPESEYGRLFAAGADAEDTSGVRQGNAGEKAAGGDEEADSKELRIRRLMKKVSPERVRAIAKAFAKYGAKQPEPPVEDQRWAMSLKDVGFEIVPGNYYRYLTQYAPNETSRGFWRVGSTNQPYGRFARGFEHATGRDAMYFDIDDRLFGGKPLAGKNKIELRIVYFDKGNGSWAYCYDSTSGLKTVAIAKKNSGEWKEYVCTLEDAYFGNRLEHESDFALLNADTEDDLFSRIETLKK